MKPSEAAKVIAKLSAIDNRTESKAAALAWAEALDDSTTLADALAAVTQHQAESTEWCTPAHINAITRKTRRDRLNMAGNAPIPAGLTYEQEQKWRKEWAAAIGDGHSKTAAQTAANMTLPAQIERRSA